MISCNLFAYCLNNPVNRTDAGGNLSLSNWAKFAIGATIIAAAAVLTVATGGAGAGALAATIHCAAQGALVGAATQGAIGAATGAVSGAVTHRLSTGSWEGAGQAAINGAATGFMTGAATGAITGALTSPFCFVAGTTVLTSAGAAAIETIREGDMVWAWNEETGEVNLKRVLDTYENETCELVHVFVNGEEIIATPAHPFYSPVKGWTQAVHLRAGDILVLVNGEYVVVEKIQHEILESPVKVYNFHVEDYHTYYVTEHGVLVHNSCSGSNSAKLRANLQNAGDIAPASPNAAHHIVAATSKKAASARAILDRFGIGINDAVNGVFLPTTPGSSGAALHTTLHTNAYYNKVNQLLQGAKSADDVAAILGTIKNALLNNCF